MTIGPVRVMGAGVVVMMYVEEVCNYLAILCSYVFVINHPFCTNYYLMISS